MKFVKEVREECIVIPAAALKLCGLDKGEQAELHTLSGVAVVHNREMTAMEMIQVMDALHQLEVELALRLTKACGPCDECEDGCPYDDLGEESIGLPDYLREEAGIPENAKLCAYVNEEENAVTITAAGYEHDLRDVPPYLLEMLAAAGVCLGTLEEHLILGDVVYGAKPEVS